jgi:hypothetical protein
VNPQRYLKIRHHQIFFIFLIFLLIL